MKTYLTLITICSALMADAATIAGSLTSTAGNTSTEQRLAHSTPRRAEETFYGPAISGPIGDPSRFNNVLVIDNIKGNDSTAAQQPYKFPWATCFDIWDTNAWSPRGAIAASKPGDWIYFAPSPETYYVPQIPLGIWGTNETGLNLYIPEGASVVRANFGNTNEQPYLSGQAGAAFGFVILGNNSRFIHDGYLEDINNVNGAPIGWNMSAFRLPGIVTNYPATNFYVGGRGTIRGSYDVIVLQSDSTYPTASGVIEGVRLLGNYDAINNTYCNFITRNLSVLVNGTFDNGNTESRALTINDGYYADYGSTFTALSGTNPANLVAAVDLSQTTETNIAFFYGSTLKVVANSVTGIGTNFVAMKIGKRNSSLASGGMSGIAYGRWTERTPTSFVAVATAQFGPLSSQAYSQDVDTNRVVTYGAGFEELTPVRVWNWDSRLGIYTSGASYISNESNEGTYYVIRTGRGNQQPRYFSTNLWTGPYWPINGSALPSPTAYNPTNLIVTRAASQSQK